MLAYLHLYKMMTADTIQLDLHWINVLKVSFKVSILYLLKYLFCTDTTKLKDKMTYFSQIQTLSLSLLEDTNITSCFLIFPVLEV